MIRLLINFWLHHVHPRLSSLIATIGIVGLASCLLVLFVLAKLSDEVLEKEAFAFDESLLLWINQYSNPNIDRLMLIITKLGNPSFISIVFLISGGLLWWRYYRQEVSVFAIALLGAAILSTGLKLFFGKIRPQLWIGPITETSFSFPSSHALSSLVAYGFLAYLIANKFPKWTPSIYTLAAILIGAIGFSRLYLGVHWPTDIIAGYGVGFLWLTSCITILRLRKLNRG